jgi:hypothetical protein
MPFVPALAALLMLTAPAVSQTSAERGEAKLAKLLAGRVAGKPVDCVSLRNLRSSEIIKDTAIVYGSGRTLYVNRLGEGKAWSIDDDDILLTDTHSSQLCSIDTVRLIDRTSHTPSGFVFLGEFVPYTRVAKAN